MKTGKELVETKYNGRVCRYRPEDATLGEFSYSKMSGQWSWTDSFSSITGQITDMARDALVEGTEEVEGKTDSLAMCCPLQL